VVTTRLVPILDGAQNDEVSMRHRGNSATASAPVSQLASHHHVAPLPRFPPYRRHTYRIYQKSCAPKVVQISGKSTAIMSRPTDEEPELFTYDSLPPRSIRLLHLYPGKPDDPLEGHVSIASLDDELVYEALSYMYGNSDPCFPIRLNGKKHLIAENLSTALHHVRSPDKWLRIWIDAVCINQEDVSERGHQVSMMRQIYTNAALVRIWVHEPDIDPDCDAVKALQNFAVSYEEADHDCVKALGTSAEFWDPIVPLFSNAYWSRVWIQQEVLNAKEVQVHCMGIIIDNDDFTYFQSICRERFEVLLDDVEFVGSWRVFLKWRQLLLDVAPYMVPAANIRHFQNRMADISLVALLELAINLEATDERDRVYGMMHISKLHEDGDIEVDYNSSLLDVMVSAAQCHIKKARNLEILRDNKLEPRPGHIPGRDDSQPNGNSDYQITWLPRWHGPGRRMTFASKRTTALSTTKYYGRGVRLEDNKLQILGFKIDRVKRHLPFGANLSGTLLKDLVSSPLYCHLNEERFEVKGDSYPWSLLLLQNDLDAAPDRILAAFKDLKLFAEHPDYADLTVENKGAGIADVLGQLSEESRNIVHGFLSALDYEMLVETDQGRLGRMDICDAHDGDEVWVALGCGVPILLRPHGDDYKYVGAMLLPEFETDACIEQLREEMYEGDQCGEYLITAVDVS
jgi:hypothetical protein